MGSTNFPSIVFTVMHPVFSRDIFWFLSLRYVVWEILSLMNKSKKNASSEKIFPSYERYRVLAAALQWWKKANNESAVAVGGMIRDTLLSEMTQKCSTVVRLLISWREPRGTGTRRAATIALKCRRTPRDHSGCCPESSQMGQSVLAWGFFSSHSACGDLETRRFLARVALLLQTRSPS